MTATKLSAPKIKRAPKKPVLDDTEGKIALLIARSSAMSGRTNEFLGKNCKKNMVSKVHSKSARAKTLRLGSSVGEPFKFAYVQAIERIVLAAAKEAFANKRTRIDKIDVNK